MCKKGVKKNLTHKALLKKKSRTPIFKSDTLTGFKKLAHGMQNTVLLILH